MNLWRFGSRRTSDMYADAGPTAQLAQADAIQPLPLWLAVAGGLVFASTLGASLEVLGPLTVVALAGIVVALISLARPHVAVFLFMFLLYSNAFEVGITVFGAPPMSLAFAGLVVTALAHRYGMGVFRPVQMVVWLPLAIYGLAILTSALISADIDRSLSYIYDYLKYMVFIAILVLSARTLGALRLMSWAFILAGTSLAAITVYQVVSGSAYQFYGFGKLQAQIVVFGQNEVQLRPAGSISDPNFYAMLLLPLIPLCIHRYRYEKRAVLRWFALLSSVVLAIAMLATYSRGGFLALGFVLVALVIARFISRRVILYGAVIGLLVIPLLPVSYLQRALSLTQVANSVFEEEQEQPAEDTSSTERRIEMLAGLYMFRDHPLLGVGIKNYPVYFQEYARPLGTDKRERRGSHSLYVEILAETGLVGIVTFMTIFVSLFWTLWYDTRLNQRNAEQHDLALTTIISISGYLIASMFLHAAYPLFLWMWVGLGLAIHTVIQNHAPIASVKHSVP